MRKEFAILILMLISAIVIEESHNLFSHFPVDKLSLFPLNPDKGISVQWYVHDLSQCISAILIALGFVYAFKYFSKNMMDIGLIYLLYRCVELVVFLLWNKQGVHFWIILCTGLLFILIVTRWKKD